MQEMSSLYKFLLLADLNGFRLNPKTFEGDWEKDVLVLYFDVEGGGRSLDEISFLARFLKVVLMLITDIWVVSFRYKVV